MTDVSTRGLLGDANFLTAKDVAALLHCSVDTVRRIPRDRLPVYRPAKRNIYLREDVTRYVKSCRVESCGSIERLLVGLTPDVLNLASNGARERSHKRRTQ